MKQQVIQEFHDYKKMLLSGISRLFHQYNNCIGSSYHSIPEKNRWLFNMYNMFLSLYITTITYLVHSSVFETTTSTIRVCISGILLTILIFHLILFFCGKILSVRVRQINSQPKPLNQTTLFLFAVATFGVLMIAFLVNFPGEMPNDVKLQWVQVQQFKFFDWHPVIHTFMMWLITRIYDHYALVILVQTVLFSYAAGYLIATLESWGFTKKYLLPVGLFIILNPYTQSMMMMALKDTAFTLLLTFLAAFMIHIYLSEGKWFSKTSNIIRFAVCTGLATLVRHNGMFFTVPVLFFIILFYVRREWKVIPAVLATLLVIAFIRFPLYSWLKVTYPDNTYIESVGLPMTVMGNILIQNPEALPAETKSFLNEIASDKEWHDQYVLNDYNSIKISPYAYHITDVIQNIPAGEFAEMVMNTVKADKLHSMQAIRDLTVTVWGLQGDPVIITIPNADSISKETNKFRKGLKMCLGGLNFFIMSIPVIKWAFGKIGWQILVLLLAGIVACCRNGFKPLLLIVPSVMYNLGTMLLLCTPEDVRFFHFNVVITLPLVLVLGIIKDSGYLKGH